MSENNRAVTYPYSFAKTLFPVLFFLALIGGSIYLLATSNDSNYKDILSDSLIIAAADTFFMAMALFAVFKYMIPALKGDIILEINDNGIIDHKKNVMASWNDISDIGLVGGKWQTFLNITFKADTDYAPMRIRITYAKGGDNEIRNTAKEYLERSIDTARPTL
jgi:hypothetical protein